MAKTLTYRDITVGGRYRGGKDGRIRVVTDLHGAGFWVWWRANSMQGKPQCVSMPTFLKWATERMEEEPAASPVRKPRGVTRWKSK